MKNTRLTIAWLRRHEACEAGLRWFLQTQKAVPGLTVANVVTMLCHEDRLDWALWLVTRRLTASQCLRLALYVVRRYINANPRLDAKTVAMLRTSMKIATDVLAGKKKGVAQRTEDLRSTFYEAQDGRRHDGRLLAIHLAYAANTPTSQFAEDIVYFVGDCEFLNFQPSERRRLYTDVINYGLRLTR